MRTVFSTRHMRVFRSKPGSGQVLSLCSHTAWAERGVPQETSVPEASLNFTRPGRRTRERSSPSTTVIFLENDSLRVSVLHPEGDRSRLGPRFCTGGYVYQVEDLKRGPLLAGPEFPDAEPSVLNGQGMPDVFQFTLYDSPEEIPEKKLIPGVGIIDNRKGRKACESHFQSAVEEFARWEIEQTEQKLIMRTKQGYRDWRFALSRTLELSGRRLRSKTALHNLGPAPLPFRWFAHPFFPLTTDRRCAILPQGYTVADNPGFSLDAEGLLVMKESAAWDTGHYQLLSSSGAGVLFGSHHFHPLVSLIDFSSDFVPSKVALWANDRTFSCEPFHEALIAPDDYQEWSVTLDAPEDSR